MSESYQAEQKSSLGVPIAIVIAAALIAGAILFSGDNSAPGGTARIDTNATAPTTGTTPEIDVAPVTAEDYIRGNPNAPVLIVEYSDFDCPFCKNFHETMVRIMDDFGDTGEVAWVYRHFPIAQLHPNSPKVSEASECVAELGGNDAFWDFSDLVFGERDVNDPTDLAKLPEFAEKAGIDRGQFELCYNSGKYTEAIQQDVVAAQAAGARGTPYSIVIAGAQKGVISGAQPYSDVRSNITNILEQLKAQEAAN